MVLFCGCSPSPQERLVRKIVDADRVLVVQRAGSHATATASIQGDEVRQLARAIAAAWPTGEELSPDSDFTELEFLRGTNRLALLRCSPDRYWIDNKGYSGATGFLLDTRNAGPMHLRLSNGFRGFIYFILDTRNGSDIAMENGAYQFVVPAHGIVTCAKPCLLYSWPETACFMDGTEVPIQADAQAPKAAPDDKVILRSLGTFGVNGLAFAAFHVGTQLEFDRDRYADVAPLFPGFAYVPNHRLARPVIWVCATLAILLVCLGLIFLRLGYLRRATRRSSEAELPVGELDAPTSSASIEQCYRRPPLPFYRKALLARARQAVIQLPFLRSIRRESDDPSRPDRRS
jgi:hypothetical protein